MIYFQKVRDVKTPQRGTSLSAGIDFFIPNDFPNFLLHPGQDILIPSGIKMRIPEHCCLLGVDKSGIASSYEAKARRGISADPARDSALIVGAKLIDADYPGEIHLHLINVGKNNVLLSAGMKIAQFILIPVFYESLCELEELQKPQGDRTGGFSSTGV